MSTRSPTLTRLQDILRQHLQIAVATTDATDLQTDLGLDSLQQLTFVVETENAFGICFQSEDEKDLRTLGDVANYIERHQAQADAGAPNRAHKA